MAITFEIFVLSPPYKMPSDSYSLSQSTHWILITYPTDPIQFSRASKTTRLIPKRNRENLTKYFTACRNRNFMVIINTPIVENTCMRSQLLPKNPDNAIEIEAIITEATITANIIATCILCGCVIMSVIPQGAFAARKVRMNEEKLLEKGGFEKSVNKADDPTHYSSKFMNSIWGMYNRYSVHNFKKNMDAVDKTFNTNQQKKDSVGYQGVSVDRSADYKGSPLTVTTTAAFLPGLL